MEQEIWKDIPGFEGSYQASILGKIRNKKTLRILKQSSVLGYRYVTLKRKGYRVHRLIAFTFLGLDKEWKGYGKSFLVCHRDDNPENNSLSNLYLGNQKENINDIVVRKGFNQGENSGRSKLTKNDILKIRLSFNGSFGEYTRLAKLFGVSSVTISKIKHRKTWKHL